MENNEIMTTEEAVETYDAYEDDYSDVDARLSKKNVGLIALGGAALVGVGALVGTKVIKPAAAKGKAKFDAWNEARKEKKSEKAEAKAEKEYVKIDDSKEAKK